MSDNQYYRLDNDKLTSKPQEIKAVIGDITMRFITDNGVFSKNYLDYATRILLENIDLEKNGMRLLDLGCGYGPVAIYLNKKYECIPTLVDVNPRALDLARQNLVLNSVNGEVIESDSTISVKDQKFDVVVTNPPIRAGKETVYKFFTDSYDVLDENGILFVVIQYQHGAPSAIKKLETIFPCVDIIYKKKGFFVIKCRKNS